MTVRPFLLRRSWMWRRTSTRFLKIALAASWRPSSGCRCGQCPVTRDPCVRQLGVPAPVMGRNTGRCSRDEMSCWNKVAGRDSSDPVTIRWPLSFHTRHTTRRVPSAETTAWNSGSLWKTTGIYGITRSARVLIDRMRSSVRFERQMGGTYDSLSSYETFILYSKPVYPGTPRSLRFLRGSIHCNVS